MLRFENLSKNYGTTWAVKDLTFNVQPGEVFGFLGPNGAGKTTTIKMACGMLPADRGDVFIDGRSMRQDSLLAKSIIGYVPDGAEPFEQLTGKEYVMFMADIYKVEKHKRDEIIPQLIERYEMTQAWNDRISTYSRGMKQKIAIIGAILHEPKIWILDEPMVGLDPKSAHLLKEDMERHCEKGNSVFFSTHVLEVAEKICDRIAIIHKGQCLAVGTVAELQAMKQDALGNDIGKAKGLDGEAEGNGMNLEALFLELTK